MSAQAQIAKLSGLLARVQKNAETPREIAHFEAPVPEAHAPVASTAPVASAAPVVSAAPVRAPSAPAVHAPSAPAVRPPSAVPVSHQPTQEIDDLELDEPMVTEAPPKLPSAPAPVLAPEFDLDEPMTLDAADEDQDEELADLSEGDLEVSATSTSAELDLDEGEIDVDVELDEPPESGSAPVSQSLAEALAAAEHAEPLTPPPESGAEPRAASIPAQAGPTMEQLGQTIHLDEGPTQDFEVDEPVALVPEAKVSPSPFEAELPSSPVGSYHDGITLPPEARAELERVRLGQSTEVEAEIFARPSISTNVVDFVGAQRGFAPESFVVLLDASLGL